MLPKLSQVGQITRGGTVYAVALDEADRLWAATPAGLFCRDNGDWQSVPALPLARVSTVATADQTLWVTGDPNAVFRSNNCGQSWQRCLIEQTDAAVLSIVPSPSYATDRVVLAGTLGAGILRSTNGGKHFELANYGLEGFTIFQLAVAPAWSKRYSFAFAVTGEGVYQSPNGGRGWRLAELGEGLENVQPIALAVSPTFTNDGTVYVGCADGEVLVSADNGRSFSLLTHDDTGINCIAVAANNSLLVAPDDGGVFQAVSDGTDKQFYPTEQPITQFSAQAQTVYAANHNGLLQSTDAGQTWQTVVGLNARRFIWFDIVSDLRWLAAGPDDGVWLTIDSGKTWHPIWNDATVLSIATSGDHIWVASEAGLFISDDFGKDWQQLNDQPISAVANVGSSVWVGDEHTNIWENDKEVAAPSEGKLLGLFAHGEKALAAIWRSDARMVQLWQADANGQNWTRIFAENAAQIVPRVCASDSGLFVGIGRKLYQHTANGWKKIDASSPIVSIQQLGSKLIVIQSDQITMLTDKGLVRFAAYTESQSLAAASIVNGSLVLCSALGTVWRVSS